MKQHVVIADEKGSRNIWEVKDCIKVYGEDTYEVHTRTTTAFIEKDLCLAKDGSSLLYYTGNAIDINESEIDLEGMERLFKCRSCLYVNGCNDAYLLENCEDCLDINDEYIEEDRSIDMGYIEDYYLDNFLID